MTTAQQTRTPLPCPCPKDSLRSFKSISETARQLLQRSESVMRLLFRVTLPSLMLCVGCARPAEQTTATAPAPATAPETTDSQSTVSVTAAADSAAPAASPAAASDASAHSVTGTIGVSLLTLDNPFFKVIGDNIASEGAKHGYETLVVSGEKDVARQSNQIKDFITRRVAAIVLSPCDSKSIVPVIQEANAAGIPVFTVDIPCNEPGVTIATQVATDNFGGGREAAAAMIEALGEAGGKIAVLHFKQAESCQLRVKGFREVIDAHNETAAAKIEIVTELESGGDKDAGYKAAQDAIQAHSDLRGVFAINDPAALGARAALEKAGKADQVVIVGFDGQPEGRQAIRDGKIYADPVQFPDQMGIKIVEAILQYSRGEDLPPQTLIPTQLYRKSDAEKDAGLK